MITDTYNQPNKTPEEIEAMISNGSVDILGSFSEACREEFEQTTNLIASGSCESLPTSGTSVQRVCRLEDGAKTVAVRVDTQASRSDTLTTARRVNTGSYRLVRLRGTISNVLKILSVDQGVRFTSWHHFLISERPSA